MNHVTLAGAVTSTWEYGGDFHARLAYTSPNHEAGYFNVRFPGQDLVVIRRTAGQSATQKRSLITAAAPQGIQRGQALVVSGRLQHRDYQVSLEDFIERANGELTDEERETLSALSEKVGQENRSHYELLATEVVLY